MHWTDRRAALANIAHELRDRGWKLFGYTADASDSMTDYYAPAHWDGIATRDGFTIVADMRYTTDSGKEQSRNVPQRGDTCDECQGSGNDAKGHRYEDRDLPGHSISPITYNGMGWGAGIPEGDQTSGTHGIERCHRCAGRGWLSGTPKVEHVCTWPAFQANPPRKLWHIEKAGQILASGIGLEACSAYGSASHAAVAALCDRIEAATKPAGRAPVVVAQGDRGVCVATITENDDKDGLELRFPAKPAPEVLDRLKAAGWRWSRFSSCWYKHRSDEARVFAQSIAGALAAQP